MSLASNVSTCKYYRVVRLSSRRRAESGTHTSMKEFCPRMFIDIMSTCPTPQNFAIKHRAISVDGNRCGNTDVLHLNENLVNVQQLTRRPRARRRRAAHFSPTSKTDESLNFTIYIATSLVSRKTGRRLIICGYDDTRTPVHVGLEACGSHGSR